MAKASNPRFLLHFNAVFGSLPIPVSVTDSTDRKIVWVNKATLDLYGLKRSRMIGHTPAEVFVTDTDQRQQTRAIQAFWDELKRNGTATGRFNNTRADGTPTHVSVVAFRIRIGRRDLDVGIAHLLEVDQVSMNLVNRGLGGQFDFDAFLQTAVKNPKVGGLLMEHLQNVPPKNSTAYGTSKNPPKSVGRAWERLVRGTHRYLSKPCPQMSVKQLKHFCSINAETIIKRLKSQQPERGEKSPAAAKPTPPRPKGTVRQGQRSNC
jgi:PAS domain S-box-containing protein